MAAGLAAFAMVSTQAIAATIVIDPTSAVSTLGDDTSPSNAINGTALSDGGASVTTGSAVPATWPTNKTGADSGSGGDGTNFADNWVTGGGSGLSTSQTFAMTLGGTYNLTSMHYWAYGGVNDVATRSLYTRTSIFPPMAALSPS